MMQLQSIRYLRNTDIDRKKWDECIALASNGLIYATSVYLDHLTPNWEAMVLGNYELVMPLPVKSKWGIQYLYHPLFVAQLGVFGNSITASTIELFLNAIPAKFKYLDFPLNAGNVFNMEHPSIFLRKNYILPLNAPYEKLYENYRQNVKRNIKKALQYQCHSKTDLDANDVITLAENFTPGVNKENTDFSNFRKLYTHLKNQEKAKTYGVFDARNQLIASCVFFFSNKRAFYILVGNHPNGRTLGASHMLIDAFIRDHANQDLILDFEGGDAGKLAFFYSSFGSVEEIYPGVRSNRLPWFLKWLKK